MFSKANIHISASGRFHNADNGLLYIIDVWKSADLFHNRCSMYSVFKPSHHYRTYYIRAHKYMFSSAV